MWIILAGAQWRPAAGDNFYKCSMPRWWHWWHTGCFYTFIYFDTSSLEDPWDPADRCGSKTAVGKELCPRFSAFCNWLTFYIFFFLSCFLDQFPCPWILSSSTHFLQEGIEVTFLASLRKAQRWVSLAQRYPSIRDFSGEAALLWKMSRAAACRWGVLRGRDLTKSIFMKGSRVDITPNVGWMPLYLRKKSLSL